jgi:hypothetical protein
MLVHQHRQVTMLESRCAVRHAANDPPAGGEQIELIRDELQRPLDMLQYSVMNYQVEALLIKASYLKLFTVDF